MLGSGPVPSREMLRLKGKVYLRHYYYRWLSGATVNDIHPHKKDRPCNRTPFPPADPAWTRVGWAASPLPGEKKKIGK